MSSFEIESERLSREFKFACGERTQLVWADERAERLFGARPGRALHDLCVTGLAVKADEFIERARHADVKDWELSLISTDGRPTPVLLAAAPAPPHVVVVGQLLPESYALALDHMQASMDEVVDLNREIARGKHEIARVAEQLTRANQELQDSNRGVLSLHKELEDRAEALSHSTEIKSRVVSSVSHEFRTPLHSILGLTQLLLDNSDGALNEEQSKQVRFIRASAEELIALVNDLLDLSKIEAGKISLRIAKFSAQDFMAALRGALRPLQPTDRAVDLVFDDPAPDFELETDRPKLAQVARNLVSNALKFTLSGRVAVKLHCADDGRAILTVTDTGVGIPSEDVDRIFEEFTQLDHPLQARSKGTGLGLPIVRRLADLLCGEVTVESTVGEGSSFTVTVPRVHPDVLEMHHIEQRSQERDPGKLPVLVVEDDRRSLFIYERYLAMAGFQVIPARTVDAARDAISRDLPAAVVVDVFLEEETTWSFLAELKRDARTRNIPVLVVTVTNKEAHARALGADEFWLKPVDQDRLLKKLQSLVDPARKVKVLVIDDDEKARYLIRKHLAGLPYQLLEAPTGHDGIALAQRELPHVVLLDFLLEEMTAFDVLDDLKSNPQTRAIPVIIVTSHVLDATERRRLAEGTEAVISKQNLSRELAINRIRDALRKSGVETRY